MQFDSDFAELLCSGICGKPLIESEGRPYIDLNMDMMERLAQDRVTHLPDHVKAFPGQTEALKPLLLVQTFNRTCTGKEKIAVRIYCQGCWADKRSRLAQRRVDVLGDNHSSFFPYSLMAERCFPFVQQVEVPLMSGTKQWRADSAFSSFSLKEQMILMDEKIPMCTPQSSAVTCHDAVPGMFSLPFYLDMDGFHQFYGVRRMTFTESRTDNIPIPLSDWKRAKAKAMKEHIRRECDDRLMVRNHVHVVITDDISDFAKRSEYPTFLVLIWIDVPRSAKTFLMLGRSLINGGFEDVRDEFNEVTHLADMNKTVSSAIIGFDTDHGQSTPVYGGPLNPVSYATMKHARKPGKRVVLCNATDLKEYVMWYEHNDKITPIYVRGNCKGNGYLPYSMSDNSGDSVRTEDKVSKMLHANCDGASGTCARCHAEELRIFEMFIM